MAERWLRAVVGDGPGRSGRRTNAMQIKAMRRSWECPARPCEPIRRRNAQAPATRRPTALRPPWPRRSIAPRSKDADSPAYIGQPIEGGNSPWAGSRLRPVPPSLLVGSLASVAEVFPQALIRLRIATAKPVRNFIAFHTRPHSRIL